MTNRFRGEASFTHEGRTIKLLLNMDAFFRAEAETGTGLLDLIESGARIDLKAVLLRHAAIEAGEQEMSAAEMGEIIMASLFSGEQDKPLAALKQLIEQVLPKAEPGAEGNAPLKAKDGTGMKS